MDESYVPVPWTLHVPAGMVAGRIGTARRVVSFSPCRQENGRHRSSIEGWRDVVVLAAAGSRLSAPELPRGRSGRARAPADSFSSLRRPRRAPGKVFPADEPAVMPARLPRSLLPPATNKFFGCGRYLALQRHGGRRPTIFEGAFKTVTVVSRSPRRPRASSARRRGSAGSSRSWL